MREGCGAGRNPVRNSFPALSVAGLLLAGCGAGPLAGPLKLEVEADNAVSALQRINEAGAQCWIGSSDAAFRRFELMPELDTQVGRPRLLLVEDGNAQGLPALVIEASGSPLTISTYGKLADTRTGNRVNSDIVRWSRGTLSCRD